MINEKVVKNTVWNSVGMLTYFACQWFITVIIVWLSDDFHDPGNLWLAMNVSNILFVLAAYNNRYFQVSDIKSEYNDSEYVVARIITCVGSVLLCTGFVFIVDYSGLQRLIIIIYMVFRANEAFVDVLYGIDQKSWRMDYIGISMIIRGITILVVFSLTVWLFSLLYAVIGIAVASILINFVFDVRKTKKLAKFSAYALKKVFSLLKRCFPLMLVLLISTVIVFYARYSIERIYGENALGIYSTAVSLTMLIQVSASLLFTPLVNLLTESLKEENKQKFFRLFSISFLIISGITIGFTAISFFFGKELLNLLYGDSIVPYAYLMTGASIAAGLTSFMWFMNVVFSSVRDIKGIFVCNLIGVIICFIIAESMLINNGLQGANQLMSISQGVALICTLIRLLWVTKKRPAIFTGE